jgi:hypothetical protein
MSFKDTEQGIRQFIATQIVPKYISVTGLTAAFDAASKTITVDAGTDLETAGLRSGQKLFTSPVVNVGNAGPLTIAEVLGNVITVDEALVDENVVGLELDVKFEFAWQGVRYDMATGKPFVAVAWIPGEKQTIELGKVPQLAREVGMVQFSVWVPDHEGMQAALDAADMIASKMRMKILIFGGSGDIKFREPSIQRMSTKDGWLTVIVTVTYWRDVRPTVATKALTGEMLAYSGALNGINDGFHLAKVPTTLLVFLNGDLLAADEYVLGGQDVILDTPPASDDVLRFFDALNQPSAGLSLGYTGVIDGDNRTFVLDQVPEAVLAFRNGMLQAEPDDYTIADATVLFSFAPVSGDKLTFYLLR